MYWLSDDGGLSILVPYLLSQSKFWSGTSLRVFAYGKAGVCNLFTYLLCKSVSSLTAKQGFVTCLLIFYVSQCLRLRQSRGL